MLRSEILPRFMVFDSSEEVKYLFRRAERSRLFTDRNAVDRHEARTVD